MAKYQAYLIDLDGTMYRGNAPIPEAADFIRSLQSESIPFRFVTNNSSRTRYKTMEKLKENGIQAEESHILTPSIIAADYIKSQQEDARVFKIGEHGVEEALHSRGLKITEESPDYVLVGIDRHVTYHKLKEACLHIQKGAQFIATNPDLRVPTEEGFVPGNGAYVELIRHVTKTEPIVVGKPDSLMIELALDELNLPHRDVIMVGDNYDTDIMAGIEAGIDTLHVETGVTSRDDLKKVSIQPTYSVKSLADWKQF
ncbi:TIGR01457 family HAD-type hydrolase [Alkalibacillus salilacus]|uniref:4-nitrophenyl phosphatase n=1 Tax=Alkalibacillus salilacus TaxID=284582 RepID=A0ABT9VEZ1_9BACI|nr:TIGR01457 family HAD-type hydrolase [Alkalibacillus salilacus]MDQ0159511.1 4-nitrophenyl phosphatase [Alkalibacillus salilacus]